ncbi:hypothetical protein FPANT_2861 [Fusarium pseudoanthophilum]|uniref:Uncharacterized protein n=1 Tax=Fusarium pseudoanthophilum TaxID=48495 RepID=A0A8H5UWP6_9HYPO|nr:hypothetical protein FPANT_2861 [Fusarium pseudoanthophilum]
MWVETANKTTAFIIRSPKKKSKHTITSTFNFPLIMSSPHYIKVPHGQDHSPDTQQEPASFSEQMMNWLREGHKDMPWHNIDSVVASNTPDNSSVNIAPSDTIATQGSGK